MTDTYAGEEDAHHDQQATTPGTWSTNTALSLSSNNVQTRVEAKEFILLKSEMFSGENEITL